jgi:hypothetical protein
MPLLDDATVFDDAVLFRVLLPGWTTTKGGTYRLASHAFLEARGEVSLFLDAPGLVEELRRVFPGKEIASVSASGIRGAGLVIERRPAECPPDFRCDRSCHVIVGPAQELQRNDLEKRYRSIAKHPSIKIFPPEQPPQK